MLDPNYGMSSPRICPICGYEGPFQPFKARAGVQCPRCESLERHRLLKLMFDRLDVLPKDCRLLHFAPEMAVTKFVRPLCREYVTADLMAKGVDLALDIENIDLEDCRFDALICSHVLEHVDDAAALRELYRILSHGGIAILAVPVVEGWDTTYEDPAITDEAGRLKHFGQKDHLRHYGRDFRQRVLAAGFELEEFVAEGADAAAYGLMPGARVFLARRPRANGVG